MPLSLLRIPRSSRGEHFVSKKETKDKVDGNPKSRRKSKRKTERDNQRAALFQQRKREEGERVAGSAAAMATSSPVAEAPTMSPPPQFAFSKPTRENMSGLSSEDSFNVNANLDGNATMVS